MKNILKMLIAINLITACSGGGGGSQGSSATNVLPWVNYYVANAAALPSCAGDIIGRMYFVESDNNFQVCKSTGWATVNISTGTIVSSIKTISSSSTDYCTFVTGENCLFLGGQVVRLSDGSIFLTYKWLYTLTVSGDNDLDIATESFFIPTTFASGTKGMHPYVARSAAGYRTVYISYERSPEVVKVWFDTNNDFTINPAQDELLYTATLTNVYP